MKELIEKHIKNKLSELKYKGDMVELKNVYPSIIEDVIGEFDNQYNLNGYDCDYGATIGGF